MTVHPRIRRARQWALLLVVSAASSTVARAAAYQETTPFEGLRHVHWTTSVPRQLDVNVVEIDPAAPGVGFFVTPQNGAAPGETVRQTTRSFAEQYDAQVAVNASFFSYVSGDNMDLEGLAASNGDVYSPFQSGFAVALNISADRVATIIQATSGAGVGHTPNVPLFNAVGGNVRLLADGVNTADPGDVSLHPRTAAGVTGQGKIVLMTVDGRNAGHSLGVTTPELADLMLRFGARDAINLDGGGSTTLVFSDPVPRVVNIPVGVNNVPGSERKNGNNLGVYAAAAAQPANDRFVFSDFETGDAGYFSRSLTFSGSTEGVLTSSATAVGAGGRRGSPGSQRLVIRDDPAVQGTADNPDGWFVRHVSGMPGATTAADRTVNEVRPTTGVIGLWARTSYPGVEATIAIDDARNTTADRGLRRQLIADNQWHRYEWNLDDATQWEGWFRGDGVINGPDFTVDSIQLFGPNADAIVYIDDVFHETLPDFAPVSGDFNRDGRVDDLDLGRWQSHFGVNGDADANGDLQSDGRDLLFWQRTFGDGEPQQLASVPESAAGTLALSAAACCCAAQRRRKRGSLR